jgi:hypothetical protein
MPSDLAARQSLWLRIEKRLDLSLPNWRDRIDHFGQVEAVEQRLRGKTWTDSDVFDALLRALLSGATEWSKVERVLGALKHLFLDFDLCRYAQVTPADVRARFVPWFKSRGAGSQTLAKSLDSLAETSRKLCDWSVDTGSAESYFTSIVKSVGGDPKLAAIELGGYSSQWKLPGLGVPLAAETLRNLGFDLAKPDRHVNRACGAFGLATFRNWSDRSGTNAPVASESELVAVMTAVEQLARDVGRRTCFVDNAIWLLCAKQPSGLFLTNAELERLVP